MKQSKINAIQKMIFAVTLVCKSECLSIYLSICKYKSLSVSLDIYIASCVCVHAHACVCVCMCVSVCVYEDVWISRYRCTDFYWFIFAHLLIIYLFIERETIILLVCVCLCVYGCMAI